MRTLFKLALLVTATCTIFGCAHNYYNIPQETLEKKVKTIGIAPFFTDAASDIRHPDKDAIVTLLQSNNLKYQKELIGRLRTAGIFYAVRQVDADPARLFSSVISNREQRDDAGVLYNKYFYKKDELRQLLTENGLDAIIFVTVSGLTGPGKFYASNFLSFLETDYNYLIMTAQMLDRNGATIWEYPNFKHGSLSYPMLFKLQYPDFDEAAANLSDKVEVKFKTVAGVNAAFAKSESSKAGSSQLISTLYANQYNEMLSLLKTYQPLFGAKKDAPAPAAATEMAPVQTMAPAPVAAPAPAIAAVPEAAARKTMAAPTSLAPAQGLASKPVSAPLQPAAAPAPLEAPKRDTTPGLLQEIVPEEPAVTK